MSYLDSARLQSTLIKLAIAGTIAADVSYYQNPSSTITVFNTSLLVWAVMGGVTALAMLTGQVAGNYAIPYLSVVSNPTVQTLLDTGLNPALAAGANALALKTIAPAQFDSDGLGKTLLIGAGAYVAADYINRRLFESSLSVM